MDEGRYIIMPAGMRRDTRLQLGHMRVAMVLGAYSRRSGWTDLSQEDIGEIAELSRKTVNKCVGELVDWGWVARRKKNGKNQYVYRFIMDREDNCEAEVTVPPDHCEARVTDTVTSGVTFNKEDSSSLKSSSSSRAGACEAGASPARSKATPQLTVRPSDVSWPEWMKTLPAEDAEAAEAAGVIIASARWPGDGVTWSVAKPAVDIAARIIGEGK